MYANILSPCETLLGNGSQAKSHLQHSLLHNLPDKSLILVIGLSIIA